MKVTGVDLDRRRFIKQSALGAGFLLVGVQLPARSSTRVTGKDAQLVTDAFIRLAPNNSVTILMNHSEFGNGAYTSLSMMVAEELDLDWDLINLEAAPTETQYYSPLFGEYLTAGSVSTASSFMPMRLAGARTRALLLEAAAMHWQTDVNQLSTHASYVSHEDGRRIAYGDLIPVIRTHRLSAPAEVVLKAPAEYRILGKPTRRIEAREKLDGSAVYGIDIRLPNMVYGVVQRPPVFGARVVSFDADDALKVPGVLKAKTIDVGVVVLARDYWTAKKGAGLVKVVWDNRQLDELSTAGFYQEYRELSAQPGMVAEDIGDAKVILASGRTFFEAVYEMPYLAHATMEPMNCTAHVTADSCEVWVPTQNQTDTLKAVMEVTDFSEDQIQIHTTLLGGAFGRRSEWDFVTQAVMVSKALRKPVQVVWSREEDTQHGFYRPASMSRFQVGLGSDGLPVQWERQVAQPNLGARYIPPLGLIDFDPFTIAASVHDYPLLPKHFYKVEGVEVTHTPVDLGVPVGFWRSPPNSLNVFYTESVMDELAHLAGQDPLAYRLKFLSASPRHKVALEQVALQAGWGSSLPEGNGRGIAINDWPPMDEDVTVAAVVAEVSITNQGKLKVHRVDCVIDCGFAVNPDSVKAQLEGSIIMGMSAALFEQITLDDGRIAESNFDDYRIARLRDTPEINVSIVKSDANPTGSGEPGVSPIVPAITNAIFAITGKRLRRMPIGRQKLV